MSENQPDQPDSVGARQAGPDWQWPQRHQDQLEEDLPAVRAGVIGRGYAGKTALFRALAQGPLSEYLPSGLHLDVGDPRQVARLIREAEETHKLLEDVGLPPTLEASEQAYFLFDGESPVLAFHMREVIGQILTHTLPDSSEEQQTRYHQYMGELASTQVLWVAIPTPPPDPTPRDKRRYNNDLRLTSAYLREALRHRRPDQPCAVALVLTKIDSLFPVEEEAREVLADEMAQNVLGPLVNVVNTSRKVLDAAIFPTSSFGFGNATALPDHEATTPQSSSPQLYTAEPAWVLKRGASQEPFNLTALTAWTLWQGLRNQEVDTRQFNPTTISQVGRQLQDDLQYIESWIIPVKTTPSDQR